MILMYVLGFILSVALLVYLVIVLFFPEYFT